MHFVSGYDILKAENDNLKAGLKMEEFVKLLDKHLDYIRHEIIGDTIYIYVRSNREEPVCPYCGMPSSRRHSVYSRSFQNLPTMGKNKDYSGEQKNVLRESRLSTYNICRNLCISAAQR